MKKLTMERLFINIFEGLAIGIFAYIYILVALSTLTIFAEFQTRFSLCFVLFIGTLIGLLFALVQEKQHSIGMTLIRSIFTVLAFYMVQSFSQGVTLFIEKNIFPISCCIEESELVLYATFMFVFTSCIYCTALYTIAIRLYQTQIRNQPPKAKYAFST